MVFSYHLRAKILLLLLLPALIYFLVELYWHKEQYYRITGDEPHYLLITDSILNDGDLRVENNYLTDTRVSLTYGKRINPGNHMVNGFSVHNIGLPILLLVPYCVKGVTGAKFFLPLLYGFSIPILFFHSSKKIIGSDRWAAFLAVTLASGLPFIPASNQIYPDLLGGILILHVLVIVFDAFESKSINLLQVIWIGIEIAFLPWLHIRLVLPAMLLLFSGFILLVKLTSFHLDLLIKHSALFIIPFTSIILLLLYNHHAFGNIFGPYKEDAISLNLLEVSMILAGLIWDRQQGILFQQPFLLLSLLGFIPFLREKRWQFVLVSALFFSITLLNAMHTNWYGGASFWGRFGWASAVLWIYPSAYLIKGLIVDRWGSIVAGAIFSSSLLLQVFYGNIWLTRNKFLYNHNHDNTQQWATVDLPGSLLKLDLKQASLLPDFHNFDRYLNHGPNYTIAFASLILIICGSWLYLKAGRRIAVLLSTIVILGLVASLFLIQPSNEMAPLIFPAASLPGHIGCNDHSERIAIEGEKGYLIFGPYIPVYHNGVYQITLKYQSSSVTKAFWDVSIGAKTVTSGNLPPTDEKPGTLKVIISDQDLNRNNYLLEFRIFYFGKGALKVTALEIVPVESDS